MLIFKYLFDDLPWNDVLLNNDNLRILSCWYYDSNDNTEKPYNVIEIRGDVPVIAIQGDFPIDIVIRKGSVIIDHSTVGGVEFLVCKPVLKLVDLFVRIMIEDVSTGLNFTFEPLSVEESEKELQGNNS